MWKPLAIAIVLLVAACTSTADTTTTTNTSESPDTNATTTTSLTTTTSVGNTTTTAGDPTSTTRATTTTTASPTTTTVAPPRTTTTTIPVPEGNEPPSVEITAPEHLSAHNASFDTGRNDNGAVITFSATASDPNGDSFTVTWSSSVQSELGTGKSISVFVSTGGFDASQPIITATATDQWGTSSSDTIQIIVWIPSDT